MNKPVIAFDCDDVLVATGSHLVSYYNELHGTSVVPADFYSTDYERVWHADRETATRDLFAYLLTDKYMELSPMNGAADTLKALSQHFSLYIVTGRPDEAEAVTSAWVDTYLPGIFSDIVFTNFFKLNDSKGILRTKAEVCKELGARWLVDDHLHHIQNVAKEGITGLLFGDLPWEQLSSPIKNVTTIKDWQELRKYYAAHS